MSSAADVHAPVRYVLAGQAVFLHAWHVVSSRVFSVLLPGIKNWCAGQLVLQQHQEHAPRDTAGKIKPRAVAVAVAVAPRNPAAAGCCPPPPPNALCHGRITGDRARDLHAAVKAAHLFDLHASRPWRFFGWNCPAAQGLQCMAPFGSCPGRHESGEAAGTVSMG